MREAFEAWARSVHGGLESGFDGSFDYPLGRILFEAWQAATERAAQVCDEHASIEGIAQKCAAAIRAGS